MNNTMRDALLVILYLVAVGQMLLWWGQFKINKHASNLFTIIGKRSGLLREDK